MTDTNQKVNETLADFQDAAVPGNPAPARDVDGLDEVPLAPDNQGAALSPLGQEALRNAAKGWPIFPIVPNGKKPAYHGGYKDATTDTKQIEAWWTANPDFNIGFCPERAGLAVIDADTYKEGCEIAALNLPETYEVASPRGGTHYYFRGSLPQTAGKLGQEIDTRGRGSYVLLPPSVVDGNAYRLKADRRMAVLPPEIAERANRKPAAIAAAPDVPLDLPGNVQRAIKRLADLVRRGVVAIEGQRGDDTTYKIACEMRDLGISPEKSSELMLEHWYPHCMPNDQPEFVRAKVASAAAYGQNAPGAHAAAPPSETFNAESLAKHETQTQCNGYARPDSISDESWKRIEPRLSRFVVTSPRDDVGMRKPEFYDDDNTMQKDPDGYVKLVQGKKGSLKTYITLTDLIVMSVSKNLKVVYFAGEGGYGIRAVRIPVIATANNITPDELSAHWKTVTPAPNLFSEDDRAAMAVMLTAEKPDIVVIDTLGQASPGQNMNSPEFGTLLTSVIQDLRRTFHCGVVVIHHVGCQRRSEITSASRCQNASGGWL